MPTLHRDFTLLYTDTGAPPVIETLKVVIRTITVPFHVETGNWQDRGYSICHTPTTEEQRDTLKRIATTNKSLKKLSSTYLRIPHHRIGHFILHQYLDYVTRKATLLLLDGTEDGLYSIMSF
jgi:hypothetical protein